MTIPNWTRDLPASRPSPQMRSRTARWLSATGAGVALYRAVGAVIAIGAMEALAALAREPLIRVPFVTSVVLVMALPASDPARARAVIGGHLLSSLAGWLVLGMAGTSEPAAAAAVGLATLVMIATRTLHPPAGLDAFLMTSQNLPAIWIFNPVLIGAVLLTVFAAAWHAGERRLRLGPG